MQHTDEFQRLIETLKLCVAALREHGVPFMLGGSLAAWARGGPEPQKDVDLMVKRSDADRALQVLGDAGMRTERPPEEWLYKAWNEDVLVDLIFGPSGLEVTDEVLARADTIPVMSVGTPVMAVEDMLITMLFSMDEHCLDYGPVVGIVRSLREQIDWPSLRARCAGSAYAKAFLTLVEELGIAPRAAHAPAAAGQNRVRVVPSGG
jgi:putative nucleotidyltransferase-like protein